MVYFGAQHVWFSASADLADDAKRDFADIGAASIPIVRFGEKGVDLTKLGDGVVFCTVRLFNRSTINRPSMRAVWND